MATSAHTIDEAKLGEFMSRFVGDLGAAMSAALVVIGDRLGLYRAMADGEPLTAEQLGQRTGTDARYVREWLCNQAAGGYVSYDPDREAFFLTPEQSLALAQEGSPAFVPGAFQVATALTKDEEKIANAFVGRHGVGWHEHHHDLFSGTERFFRPGYAANLISSWIPALDGVRARLESGARVADVGCGHGASTILMAEAFPRSTFIGFDYHGASIEHARQAAADAGLDDRVSFEVASAKQYPGDGVRPGDDVRLSSRHGRSRGRRRARSRHARRRRDVDDRRAVRRRPARGQPQPGRAGVLRRLDAWSARRPRATRRSASRSAPRQARRGCARSSPPVASRASGGQRRRRSTSCSRRARSRNQIVGGTRRQCRAA